MRENKINTFRLAILTLFIACQSSLSDEKINDLSVFDAGIEISLDLTDGKKNEVTVAPLRLNRIIAMTT